MSNHGNHQPESREIMQYIKSILLLTLVTLVILMLTLLSMQCMYMYNDYVISFRMYTHSTYVHCTYIVSMHHTINQLRSETGLVNDIITSASMRKCLATSV